MDTKKYISIGIPFYNSERYLSLAITSVIMQSYPYWELILLDDGSTDSSLDIARSFEKKDNRIRVISDGKNLKLPTRLNQLIRESHYSYIARMDADDIMHPLRLEVQLEFLLAHPQYDLVSSGIISIDSQNEIKGFRTVDLIKNIDEISISYPISHPSILAKKEWYERNLYNTKYFRAEDFELWTRAITMNDFKIALLPDLLLFYREEGNLSIDKLINSYDQVIEIYNEYNGGYIGKIKVLIKKYLSLLFNEINFLQKIRSCSNNNLGSEILQKNKKILENIIVNNKL